MDFLVFKWLHIGAMFMATAMAVGPLVVLYLVARTGDLPSIRRAFSFSTTIGRIGGAMYGLGILSGIAAALTGAIEVRDEVQRRRGDGGRDFEATRSDRSGTDGRLCLRWLAPGPSHGP